MVNHSLIQVFLSMFYIRKTSESDREQEPLTKQALS